MFRLAIALSLLVTTSTYGATVEVRNGNTLSSIAAEHLGSASRWNELCETNVDVLGTNCNLIRPGMSLQLPENSQEDIDDSPKTGNSTTNEIFPHPNLLASSDNLEDTSAWKVVNGLSVARNEDGSFTLLTSGAQDPFIIQRVAGPLDPGRYLYSVELMSGQSVGATSAARVFAYLTDGGEPVSSTVKSVSAPELTNSFRLFTLDFVVPKEGPVGRELVFRIDPGDVVGISDAPPKGYSIKVRALSLRKVD